MEIIWGIQTSEVILLVRQISLVLVGAGALWGFVFSIRDTHSAHPKKASIIDDWLGMRMFYLVLGGTFVATIAHLLIRTIVHAHEGISKPLVASELATAHPIMTALIIVLLLLVAGLLFLRKAREEKFSYYITPFYGAIFVLAFIMTSLASGWRGAIDNVQLFHFAHGFHSIFTLGSVIVLDFLFLVSSQSEVLKQHVYTLFPVISKVIWAGLAFDFLSTFLIVESFVPTEKFLFIQTVIAILIINGTILSGPIARKMMRNAQEKDAPIGNKWRRAGSVAGALSITSWLTITALDFFRDISLGYGKLFIVYLGCFAVALLGHFVFEKYEAKKQAPGWL